MHEFNLRGGLAGMLACSVISAGFSGLASGETPDEAASDCPPVPLISEARTVQGAGEIRLNDEGTLLLALDSTGNSRADMLFRVATKGREAALRAALESATEGDSFLVVERDALEYRDLAISGFGGDPETLLFVTDWRDCSPAPMTSAPGASKARVPALAISRETSAEWQQSPLQLVSARMQEPMVIGQSELEADSRARTDGPLWCMAGGTGAAACSLSFDPGGAVAAGECALACAGTPATYACCGPASPGPRCRCIVAESASPD